MTSLGVKSALTHSLSKMDSTKCIEDLSDELLVEIFSHLGFEDMVHSVQYVALRWRDIAHDIHLWKNLFYRPSWEVHDDEIVKIIQQAPKLQALLLDQRGVRSSVIQALIENCTHLKILAFTSSQRLSYTSVRNLVQKCQNIEELCVPGIILSENKSTQCIGQLQNLKSLTVRGWGDERYHIMLKPLGDGCPCLQHIDIRDRQYSTDDLQYFLNKKQHQLQSLKVNWSCESGKCVPPVLSVCKALKTLHLHNYCDINVEEAFESLRSLTSITKLHFRILANAHINRVISLFNDQSMSLLAELQIDYYENYEDKIIDVIAKNCSLLKVLNIRNCLRLTDASLQNLYILEMLEYLHLRNCGNITEMGMEFLCKCKHLKHFSLHFFYDLTEECMKKVTDLTRTLEILELDYSCIRGLVINAISSHLPNLYLFSVDYCKGVDKDALEELKIAMPQLTVRDNVFEDAISEHGDGTGEEGGGGGGEEDYVYYEENYIPLILEEPDILFDDAPFVFEQLQRF